MAPLPMGHGEARINHPDAAIEQQARYVAFSDKVSSAMGFERSGRKDAVNHVERVPTSHEPSIPKQPTESTELCAAKTGQERRTLIISFPPF